MESRKTSTDEIESALFRDGELLGDYFIVDEMPLHWPRQGILTFCSYDGVELGEACVEYLRSHGAPEYRSMEEAEAARDAS